MAFEGWMLIWFAAAIIWIKYDWAIALAFLFFVFGLMRIHGAILVAIMGKLDAVQSDLNK